MIGPIVTRGLGSIRSARRLGWAALLIAVGAALSSASAQGKADAGAADTAAPKSKSPAPGSLFPGGNSKEPVNIEADRLEYYNKDQKAIYIGSVVVIQGETTLKCSKLTIFFDRQAQAGPAAAGQKAATPPPATPAAPGTGQIKHLDAEGPVTVISKDQVAVADRAEFDKAESKVFMFGHVVMTQGTNITKGDKMTYDTTTGIATVESDNPAAGRVSGYFVPGAADKDKDKGKDKTDTKKADAKSPSDKGPDSKPSKTRPRPKKPDVNG